jgi:hypothetical protein
MGLTNRTLVPQSVFGQHALKIRPQGCYRRSRSRARVGWRLGRRESRPTRQQRPTGAKEVLSPPDGRRIRQPLNGTGRDAQLPLANQERRGQGAFQARLLSCGWFGRAEPASTRVSLRKSHPTVGEHVGGRTRHWENTKPMWIYPHTPVVQFHLLRALCPFGLSLWSAPRPAGAARTNTPAHY